MKYENPYGYRTTPAPKPMRQIEDKMDEYGGMVNDFLDSLSQYDPQTQNEIIAYLIDLVKNQRNMQIDELRSEMEKLKSHQKAIEDTLSFFEK